MVEPVGEIQVSGLGRRHSRDPGKAGRGAGPPIPSVSRPPAGNDGEGAGSCRPAVDRNRVVPEVYHCHPRGWKGASAFLAGGYVERATGGGKSRGSSVQEAAAGGAGAGDGQAGACDCSYLSRRYINFCRAPRIEPNRGGPAVEESYAHPAGPARAAVGDEQVAAGVGRETLNSTEPRLPVRNSVALRNPGRGLTAAGLSGQKRNTPPDQEDPESVARTASRPSKVILLPAVRPGTAPEGADAIDAEAGCGPAIAPPVASTLPMSGLATGPVSNQNAPSGATARDRTSPASLRGIDAVGQNRGPASVSKAPRSAIPDTGVAELPASREGPEHETTLKVRKSKNDGRRFLAKPGGVRLPYRGRLGPP